MRPGGPGSPQHVAMELFTHATDIKLNHVPYRGVAQAFNDVVGGHVPLMITGLPSPNEFINKGQLKLLGITSAQRSPVFPDQPTISEQGVAGYDFTTYAALVAPAKTPAEIVALLNQIGHQGDPHAGCSQRGSPRWASRSSQTAPRNSPPL